MPIGPKSESCLMGLILLNVYSDSAVSGFFILGNDDDYMFGHCIAFSDIVSSVNNFLLKLLPDVVA